MRVELDLDQVLRALSHPERRQFVLACRDRPRAAGELAEVIGMSYEAALRLAQGVRRLGAQEDRQLGPDAVEELAHLCILCRAAHRCQHSEITGSPFSGAWRRIPP